MKVFKPHSEKQSRAIFSEKPITLVGTGTQFGKSTIGAYRMALKMHEYNSPTDNFIVCAPTYKILNQSTLPAFMELMEGRGTHDKKNDLFKMHGGGTCYFRTEKDPDSIVGITNVRHIWGDEAGKYRLYFWENIQARAGFLGCSIDLTTSPYALNWVYKDLIKPLQAGTRDDIEFIQAASWENPYHSLASEDRRLEKLRSMDARRFKMIFGGEWGRMDGVVYDCWDDEENLVEPFELPPGTTYYGGIDWGFTDPFVFLVRAITPDGKHYGISEFYKSNTTLSEQIKVVQTKMKIFPIKRIFADPSQPGSIEEMLKNGIPIVGANNDIRRGIDAHYELIKTRRYKEFKGTCPHSRDEREMYHYPEPKDLSADQDSKELLPVDQYNHCFTADTLIETEHGPIPISDIRPGIRVLTRYGYKRVIDAWCEGIKPVIELNLLGRIIRCTPNHKIFTKDRSFVRADALTDADRYVTVDQCKNKSLTARFISFIGVRDILVEAVRGSMWLFGVTLMGPFQRAIMCITRTRILQTTGLRTSSLFLRDSTYQSTANKDTKTLSLGKRHLNTWLRLGRLQKSGMLPKRVETGIKRMLIRYWAVRTVQRLSCYVRSAARSMGQTRFFVVTQSFAPLIVSLKTDDYLGSITSSANARFVSNPLRSINTPRQSHALSHVQTKLFPSQNVYNFTVEDEFEYFANGILVSNCMDVDRYLSLETINLKKHQGMFNPPKIKDPPTRLEVLKRSSRRKSYEVF